METRPRDLREKYIVFLNVIADNVISGVTNFAYGKNEVLIPQTDFITWRLERADIPRLFKMGDEDGIVIKSDIVYQSKETTPLLELEFLEAGKQQEGDLPWYKISLSGDKEVFLEAVQTIKDREGGRLFAAPYFEEAKSRIIWGDVECEVPTRSNQFYVCKALFSIPLGQHLSELNIMESISPSKEPKRTVYDAIEAINKLAIKKFGQKIFEYKGGEYWIDRKLLEISTD
jgi:hypothetical protein